jgi:hypothetical protein
MYSLVLGLHNTLRWVVLILGLYATIRALTGWYAKRDWKETDKRSGLFFTIAIDLQLLFGLLLYFVYSEWALKAIISKGMAYVMGQSEFRFYAIEHAFYMVLGFVFAHLGSSLPKKVDDPQAKFKRASIWFGLAILLILAGIPWSRPLFPSF